MERYSRKDGGCHKFLEEKGKDGRSEEKKLELRLGPPGGDWTTIQDGGHGSVLSLGQFSCKNPCFENPSVMNRTPWQQPHFLHLQSGFPQGQGQGQGQVTVTKQSSQTCGNRAAAPELQKSEKKAFSAAASENTAAQKRTAPGPVVGWPPIRSLRKNLPSGNSLKSPPESTPEKVACSKPVENCPKSLFVKVNMDGIPIGRKVDLNAYDSYEKLSDAVDGLFRVLIAAQRDPSIGGEEEEGTSISSLADENGGYTLVYEDNEGDRMLVGDVPWHMFVATVKRLRVLRSSELPALSRELNLCTVKGKAGAQF